MQELGVQYQVMISAALFVIVLQESERTFQFIGRHKHIGKKLHTFHFSTGIVTEIEYKVINAELLALLGESTQFIIICFAVFRSSGGEGIICKVGYFMVRTVQLYKLGCMNCAFRYRPYGG